MRKIIALATIARSVFFAKSDIDDKKPDFPICNLSGQWKNQLGSHVFLTEHGNGCFVGKYHTTVESKKGAAGKDMTANVTVFVHPKNCHSFVMTVMWDGGSLTSWVGQCYINKDGEQVLDTTWMLLSPQPTLQDAWQSTRIGKDTFRRE